MSQFMSRIKLTQLLTIVIVALFIGSFSSSAQNDKIDKFTYHNSRFGFSFDFPSGLIPEDPPLNGDGRIFRSKDGQIEIIASASFLVSGDFNDERANSQEFQIESGSRITYAPHGSNWFVLSGFTANGQHFYERSILAKNCDGQEIRATVYITYSQSVKTQIEPMIGWIAKSLKGC